MEEKQKVYLIVENNGRVFARVFSSEEKANAAMLERDSRTGERTYPNPCHVIEREVE